MTVKHKIIMKIALVDFYHRLPSMNIHLHPACCLAADRLMVSVAAPDSIFSNILLPKTKTLNNLNMVPTRATNLVLIKMSQQQWQLCRYFKNTYYKTSAFIQIVHSEQIWQYKCSVYRACGWYVCTRSSNSSMIYHLKHVSWCVHNSAQYRDQRC